MSGYTKGPWNSVKSSAGYTIGPNEQIRGDYVADVHEHQSGAMSDKEAAANAALIVKAPQLIGIAEEYARFLDPDIDKLGPALAVRSILERREAVEAIIKEAGGEV